MALWPLRINASFLVPCVIMARLPGISRNLNAFLDTIALSEIGKALLALPETDDGYMVIVGSTPSHPILMKTYRDHPRFYNRTCDSTAAGRYQILKRYFDAYAEQLDLEDFSPESQDEIAIQMIRECHALDEIEHGEIQKAITLCRSRWASLPGAGYDQHENHMGDLLLAFNQFKEQA